MESNHCSLCVGLQHEIDKADIMQTVKKNAQDLLANMTYSHNDEEVRPFAELYQDISFCSGCATPCEDKSDDCIYCSEILLLTNNIGV